MSEVYKEYYRVKNAAKKELVEKTTKWISVSTFLFFINFMTGSKFMWAVFPFLGMGIGVLKKFMAYKMITYDDFDPEMRPLNERNSKKRIIQIDNSNDDDYLELKEMKSIKEKSIVWNKNDFV